MIKRHITKTICRTTRKSISFGGISHNAPIDRRNGCNGHFVVRPWSTGRVSTSQGNLALAIAKRKHGTELRPTNQLSVTRHVTAIWHRIAVSMLSLAFAILGAQGAIAQIDGFTDPFLKIDLASAESGTIQSLHVKEGQVVKKGDIIAQLDDELQAYQVEIAQKLAEADGEIRLAETLVKQRREIHERLLKIQTQGHATEGDLIRSEMELAMAEAKLMSARESRMIREIELRRAQSQLHRRKILSPIDGTAVAIHRRIGEFVSPVNPEVVTLIQTDRLLATFPIPSGSVGEFQPGKKFKISFADSKSITATVYHVGVETDAESGTVPVKLLIENPDGSLRSGEFVTLQFTPASVAERVDDGTTHR